MKDHFSQSHAQEARQARRSRGGRSDPVPAVFKTLGKVFRSAGEAMFEFFKGLLGL